MTGIMKRMGINSLKIFFLIVDRLFGGNVKSVVMNGNEKYVQEIRVVTALIAVIEEKKVIRIKQMNNLVYLTCDLHTQPSWLGFHIYRYFSKIGGEYREETIRYCSGSCRSFFNLHEGEKGGIC